MFDKPYDKTCCRMAMALQSQTEVILKIHDKRMIEDTDSYR